MQPATGLSLQRLPDTAAGLPRAALLRDGRPGGCVIDGAQLEAALRWPDGWTLLIANADCPFEESLHLSLLDAHDRVIDRAGIGVAYANGWFRDLRLLPPDTVCFRFLGDGEWSLRRLPRCGWRMPLFSEPVGVWRRFGWRRWFVIHLRKPGITTTD